MNTDVTATNALWLSADVAEACLMVYFWIKLRRLFPWFIMYVALDIGCALFLAGVLLANSRLYSDVWIAHEWLLALLELVVSIEALRRMNQVAAYSPRNLLFVGSLSAVLILVGSCLFTSSPRWPGDVLEPINFVRGGFQAWLGITLWYLWAIPCRQGQRWSVQGRQMLMLSIYMLAASVEAFSENHLWTEGKPIPGDIIMGISLGIFLLWALVMWFRPSRLPRTIQQHDQQ